MTVAKNDEARPDPVVQKQQRERHNRASEYLSDATCDLHSFGLSFPEVVSTVLYEAAALVEHLPQERPSSAEVAAVVGALEWLSGMCADALVQTPAGQRRGH